MPRKLRLAYFAHTLRSDWNNGNAHFLRGLLRALVKLGHSVAIFEPSTGWSIDNLATEAEGARSLQAFHATYPELAIHQYDEAEPTDYWHTRLATADIVMVHEWNPPALAQLLLSLRERCGYKLLFHDTHHRASSSPEQMERFGLQHFDGILAFGEALRSIYRERFSLERVWTLHEAADTTVFHPLPAIARGKDIVWIGNWGEGERSDEIRNFLLKPAAELRELARTTIYGVRYPEDGLRSLAEAGAGYGGYLPNLDAPAVYAAARATVHIPRQHYAGAMRGIPTIRVFEALACGIALVSAPWQDCEGLFRAGDFCWAHSTAEMTAALRTLIVNPSAAEAQAARGRETVLARHTCAHRALELSAICEEVLQ